MNAIATIGHALHRFGIRLLVTAMAGVATANAASDNAKVMSTLTPEAGRIVVDVQGVPPAVTPLFSAVVDQSVRFERKEVAGESRVKIHLVQGQPEIFSLGLSADGEVLDVCGEGLRDWSVREGRTTSGVRRFLDLRPSKPLPTSETGPRDYEWVIHTRLRIVSVPSTAALLLLTPGDAVGFTSQLTLQADPTLNFKVTSISGLAALTGGADTTRPARFVANGENRMEVMILQPGAAAEEAELSHAQLLGTVTKGGHSADFRLTAQFHATAAGARLRLLWGQAALADRAVGDGWHVELVSVEKDNVRYDLVADRVGTFSLDLAFAAAVIENGDWRTFDFAMPAGAAVSLQLNGLGSEVSFKTDAPIVPSASGSGWKGFLPADGSAAVAWKRSHAAVEGALFFTSDELSDVQVGAGLVSETSTLTLRVLQGKLNSVRCRLLGHGEILSVEGTNVVGWKVLTEGEKRSLEVRFSRPVETTGKLEIESQTELGSYPATVEPLRLSPEGVVRHSGFVRIANHGAVRLEIAAATGLLQLAPAQFPGEARSEEAQQIFVYRFPSADYEYRVLAKQIQPEVAVSAISTYQLADTDRVIAAQIELDVREAALREWSLRIPEDYTVASLTGNGVADYVAESSGVEGYRKLRIIFNEDVEGRQLLTLRLEKNQVAAAGEWTLPPLRFPEAKSVRGNIGVVAVPGYRIVPTQVAQLVEVPLSYFPEQIAGLQQAWRLREADWTAQVRIEALGQSIQADVFHLYSVKEGVVYGSVLLNYFVVGAPATEWRVEVPASLGNIDVLGENARRDWRRDGDQVIVSLHQPVLGAATLLITFEQPMSARGGVIKPGEVRPLGVQSERGFIEVVSPLQVKSDVRKAEGGGLLPLDALELPAEFRLLTTSPALATYQYTDRPFDLELGIQWYAQAETVDQVVDFAKLSSLVSSDGQVVTEADYFVKTRGTKALRLHLAAGEKLWETHVDNELVTARSDGDQTVIPLPARTNPNQPVNVRLRLGQASTGAGKTVKLVAPRAQSPVVINEWILRTDAGRLLIPRGSNTALVRPALTETGFEWISERGIKGIVWLLIIVALAAFCFRKPQGWLMLTGLSLCAVALALSAILMATSQITQRPNLHELTYTSTLVPAGQDLVIEVANMAETDAGSSGWGITVAIAGVIFLLLAWLFRRRQFGRGMIFSMIGIACFASGLLMQRGGAALFFGAIGAGVLLLLVVGGRAGWDRQKTSPRKTPPATPGGQIALWLMISGVGFAFGIPQPVQAESVSSAQPWIQEGVKPAEAIVQTWTIRGDRLYAEMDMTVRGTPGDSFLILRPPALLTDFKGDGLRVGKHTDGPSTAYYLAPEREGIFTAHVRFEMPIKDRTQGVALPTGAAAIERVTLELDQAGWEFVSDTAVQVLPSAGLDNQHSGATLVFAPQAVSVIRLQPKQRDVATEATQFFVEASNLFLPSPGVVNGRTRFTVRPVQGRVTELVIDVPPGLTVGDVNEGPIGVWRFDPQIRKLRITVEPAQTESFTFEVDSQLGATALPFDLSLSPLRIDGAAGEVGMLALAFGGDAQPEAIHPSDLLTVNVQDFDAALLPPAAEGTEVPVIQQVWRYGPTGGKVDLKIAAVRPEIRVSGREVLSLDDDRLLVSVGLNAEITRAGIFQLSFPLPEGLEIEALTGPALDQWTESSENGVSIVTLHLHGRTLGEQNFTLTLTGSAPHAQNAWAIPRVSIREATRQTGEALVVPGKGIRLRTTTREKVTQIDPHELGGLQPGSLAFRLLQQDWSVHLGIEALEPWVTVQALQESTLRDGQTFTRLALNYRIENAAVKQVRLRLPGLSEAAAHTVRATGTAVSDIVKLSGSSDEWEIRFQRGMAGETDVQIEFQETEARAQNLASIAPPVFVGARQTTQFIALRGSGRIELEANALPRGWTRVDWGAVPTVLQDRNDRSVPALCFRVAEAEGALAVTVRRHDVAEALKLQVTQANLTTLISNSFGELTAVDLKVDVLEKARFQVRLPEKAQLFNMVVNGENVGVVREGEMYSFHVTGNSATDQTATVHFVYSVAEASPSQSLAGPVLSVPLENVVWKVVIPTGFELADYKGSLVLKERRLVSGFGVQEYQSSVLSSRTVEAQKGVALLAEANRWLQSGDQQKAGEMLARASNAPGLDEASNEDARVQLRKLKTEQTVLGLNTRRQRLYLDNRFGAAKNEPLELAATLNPFMRGAVNFDPQQLDQLTLGNTAEENTALKGIAARLVDQQLATQPAPAQIEVSTPERGAVFTFTRSLQVDGTAALSLDLKLKKVRNVSWSAIVWPLLGLIVIAGLTFVPMKVEGRVA